LLFSIPARRSRRILLHALDLDDVLRPKRVEIGRILHEAGVHERVGRVFQPSPSKSIRAGRLGVVDDGGPHLRGAERFSQSTAACSGSRTSAVPQTGHRVGMTYLGPAASAGGNDAKTLE